MNVSYTYGKHRFPPSVKNGDMYATFLTNLGKSHLIEILTTMQRDGIKSLEDGCIPSPATDRDVACWLEIRKNFLSKGDSILDVGTNIGTWCFRMKSEGYEPTGLEQSWDIVNYINTSLKPQLSREEWKKIKFVSALESNALQVFGEKSFDVVFSKHVIEHVPNVVETLQMWKKMAKKGICGVVPIEVKEECWDPGRHTYRFSLKVLRKLLEEQGYSNIGMCSFEGDALVDGKFYRRCTSAGYWATI